MAGNKSISDLDEKKFREDYEESGDQDVSSLSREPECKGESEGEEKRQAQQRVVVWWEEHEDVGSAFHRGRLLSS